METSPEVSEPPLRSRRSWRGIRRARANQAGGGSCRSPSVHPSTRCGTGRVGVAWVREYVLWSSSRGERRVRPARCSRGRAASSRRSRRRGFRRPVDPPGANFPLARDLPVEDGSPGGHLDDLEGEVAREHRERLADPRPGQAAGQRVELSHELEQLRAHRVGVRSVSQSIGIEEAAIMRRLARTIFSWHSRSRSHAARRV